MNEITRSSRVNNALLVIQRMNEGLTVKAACPRSRAATEHLLFHPGPRPPKPLQYFRDYVVPYCEQRERLSIILVSHVNILQKLIEDGLADTTKPETGWQF